MHVGILTDISLKSRQLIGKFLYHVANSDVAVGLLLVTQYHCINHKLDLFHQHNVTIYTDILANPNASPVVKYYPQHNITYSSM